MFGHLLVHANLLTLSLWLGALTPVLAQVVKQDRFSKRVNSIIAAAVSVVVGVVTVLVKGGPLNAGDFVTTIVAIYTVAVATYHGFWKPTGVADAVGSHTQVPQAPTSPSPAPASPAQPLDPSLPLGVATGTIPPDAAVSSPSFDPSDLPK